MAAQPFQLFKSQNITSSSSSSYIPVFLSLSLAYICRHFSFFFFFGKCGAFYRNQPTELNWTELVNVNICVIYNQKSFVCMDIYDVSLMEDFFLETSFHYIPFNDKKISNGIRKTNVRNAYTMCNNKQHKRKNKPNRWNTGTKSLLWIK